MLAVGLDSATEVVANARRGGVGSPCWVLYGKPTSKQHHLDVSLLGPGEETTASLVRKIGTQELAQTSPIRQLFAPFTAKGGIRLPRYRVMRQQAHFAQARWVLSIESIKSDTMGLALVEEGRDYHLSGRSEEVCELRIGLCPVIAGVN